VPRRIWRVSETHRANIIKDDGQIEWAVNWCSANQAISNPKSSAILTMSIAVFTTAAGEVFWS